MALFPTRLAAYAVIVRDGKVLLAHWQDANGHGWTLPGGGADEGEDPVETAVREVEEETGYRVRIDELLGISTLTVPGAIKVGRDRRSLTGVRVVYTATIIGGNLRYEVDGSTDSAAWFELPEVQNLQRVSLVGDALALYRERPADGRVPLRSRR